MIDPLKFLGVLSVALICFIIYIYAVVLMHPISVYAGGWPIFLFYTFLFPVVLFKEIHVGVNARFFKTLLIVLMFNFLFLLVFKVSDSAPRSRLFVQGVPTASGGFMQSVIAVSALVLADGLSTPVRNFYERFRSQ